MYDYIKGKLARKAENYAVVEANGVGYKIITTKSSLANIKDGEVILGIQGTYDGKVGLW